MALNKFLTTLALAFSIQQAAHADWHYQRVELFNENNSRDSITASVDYEVTHVGENGYLNSASLATPVYLKVWTQQNVSSAQAVYRSMVYNSYTMSLGSILSRENEHSLRPLFLETVDLEVEDRHLFAPLSAAVVLREVNCMKCINQGIQELAIVISGVWYKGADRLDARFSMPFPD